MNHRDRAPERAAPRTRRGRPKTAHSSSNPTVSGLADALHSHAPIYTYELSDQACDADAECFSGYAPMSTVDPASPTCSPK